VLLSGTFVGSTLVWAFSVAAATAFTLKVPRSSGFGVTIIATSTIIWAVGIGIHTRYWSTVAFGLLVGLFVFEAFAYGLIMLWKDYVLGAPEHQATLSSRSRSAPSRPPLAF
jgi:hypothetical protein